MKKHLITGLVLLLPAALTLAIFLFLIDVLTKPFLGLTSHIIAKWNLFPGGIFLLTQEDVIRYTSRFLILATLFFITLLLGMIARWFFLHSFLQACDRLLLRIPLISPIYKTSQDIIKTLFSSDKKSFQQVVMAPFPKKGMFVIGLISGNSPSSCCKATGKQLISVLIPTTPNPTTGFLLMIPQEDLVYLEVKPEDALKYIISCGMISPQGGS